MEERIRARAIYKGQVQGVGFRWTAKHQAEGAEIVGWVRNEPDGSVRVEAEGRRSDVEAFLQRVREAMKANIRDVDLRFVPPQGSENQFAIHA